MNSECEYCFLSLITGNEKLFRLRPNESIENDTMPIDHGKLQMEMTCLYEPGIGSKCPQIVKKAKRALSTEALKNGESLTQYSNTPSCDTDKGFWERYA